MTPLPRVFRAEDGSVAIQDVDRFQEDIYELVRVGPRLARFLAKGQLTTGEQLQTNILFRFRELR